MNPATYWVSQLRRYRRGEPSWFSAIEALEVVGADAIPGLIEVLEDSDPDVVRGCQKALARIGPAIIPEMTTRLLSGSPLQRLSAAMMLHALGERAEPAVGALIATLKDADYCVRQWAAGALGAIGQNAWPAIPELVQAIELEGDETAREWMEFAIDRIEDDDPTDHHLS